MTDELARPLGFLYEGNVRQQKNKKDVYMPRVSINTPAPDFNLTDYTGKAFKLSALRNHKNVLLVFNRTFA
jgi:hypothetical protein